jgi:hypothetical protein
MYVTRVFELYEMTYCFVCIYFLCTVLFVTCMYDDTCFVCILYFLCTVLASSEQNEMVVGDCFGNQ